MAFDLVDLSDVAALDAVLADGTLTAPPAPTPTAPPKSVEVPVLMMPLAGAGEFAILQSHIDGWVGAYPGVDVIRQLAAMRQWCIANPRKRKTKRGVLAFCNAWLAKEQDRASSRMPAAGPVRGQKFDPVAHVNQGGQPPLNGGAGAIIDINPR